MTNEERQRFSRRLRERDAEIERLKAENAELRKSLDTWIAVHGPRAALEQKP